MFKIRFCILVVAAISVSGIPAQSHKIRLKVSRSNFPRFDRNLNSGKDPGSSEEFVKGDSTIYHDNEHPDALLLPVVPK
jgi:predicted acyl esterase